MSLAVAIANAVIEAGADEVHVVGALDSDALHAMGVRVQHGEAAGTSDARVLVGVSDASEVSKARLLARLVVVVAAPVVGVDETPEAVGQRLGLHVFEDVTLGRVDVEGRPWWLVRGRCA